MMRAHVVLILYLCSSIPLAAQDNFYIEDDDSNPALHEAISSLLEDPLDINSAAREELQALPFLNKTLTDSILAFQPDLNGLFLRNLLGRERYELLRPLVRFSRPRHRTRFNTVIRLSNLLVPALPGFTGSPLALYGRMTFKKGKTIAAGILFQKDPGETRVTDHISGYLQWQSSSHDTKLLLGSFQVHAGKGLVLSRPYGVKPGARVMTVFRHREAGARPCRSSAGR